IISSAFLCVPLFTCSVLAIFASASTLASTEGDRRMPRGKISKSSVDALNATRGKPSFLWDTELRGFGVKATPAARKVYLVQYRIGGRAGRSQRVTLGTHGNITADEARRKAKQVLGEIADGIDVAAEK